MSRGLAQGRFDHDADPLFRRLNDSLPFDHRLLSADLTGSAAWARALAGAGVLRSDELERLLAALSDLAAESAAMADGAAPPEMVRALNEARDEDVHSYVERRLVESLGALGKKLHTGRSRNDQVATDLRLWTRAALDARRAELHRCRRALLDFAERSAGVVLPGYTHLQRAQPVLLAHWALAYAEMLERDSARMGDARRRVNICPLGSGALAGTTFPIDRATLAHELGFDAPSRNSLDAVSDRDFVLETLSVCAITAAHLSRLGEDLVLYGAQEFAYFEFHDSVASGSSLMPQKKNPDAAELLRAKAGRIIGDLVALLVTVKGLPLAYNKDLQEDKEPLFDAMDHLSLSLQVVPRILDTLIVRREACARGAEGGYTQATELADYLVARGVPFREAHDLVGQVVRIAAARGCSFAALGLEEYRAISPHFDNDVYAVLPLEVGLRRREVFGGTGTNAVAGALAAARARLESESV